MYESAEAPPVSPRANSREIPTAPTPTEEITPRSRSCTKIARSHQRPERRARNAGSAADAASRGLRQADDEERETDSTPRWRRTRRGERRGDIFVGGAQQRRAQGSPHVVPERHQPRGRGRTLEELTQKVRGGGFGTRAVRLRARRAARLHGTRRDFAQHQNAKERVGSLRGETRRSRRRRRIRRRGRIRTRRRRGVDRSRRVRAFVRPVAVAGSIDVRPRNRHRLRLRLRLRLESPSGPKSAVRLV